MVVARRRAPSRAGGAFSRDRDKPWGTENGNLGNAACHSLAESGSDSALLPPQHSWRAGIARWQCRRRTLPPGPASRSGRRGGHSSSGDCPRFTVRDSRPGPLITAVAFVLRYRDRRMASESESGLSRHHQCQ